MPRRPRAFGAGAIALAAMVLSPAGARSPDGSVDWGGAKMRVMTLFTDPHSEERHYAFEVVDVVRWPEWILHAGPGEGLTPASTWLIVTTILGQVF